MKLKILVIIMEKIFGTIPDDRSRADMYLPDRLLAMSLVFLAGGIICAIIAIFKLAAWAIVFAALGIVLGIFAFLCWKNQSIRIISDEQFTYTTMFGKVRTYYFSDIQRLRRNQDSMTLFVANEKVHMESMAIISDRLADLITGALKDQGTSVIIKQHTPKINFKKTVEEQIKLEASYIGMSIEELSRLSDDQIVNAALVRAENIVASQEDPNNGFNLLNEDQRILYVICKFEMEVLNGGLCQFFANYDSTFASLVSEYMKKIDATEHKELFDSFIEKHQINLRDLSSFNCETVEEFTSQYDCYPFDDYDMPFFELTPLQNYLNSFVRKHIGRF